MTRLSWIGLVLAALVLRLVWPLADPPERLTWSNGELTDPPSIVHAARNKVLFGTWVRDDSKDLVFYPLLNVITSAAYSMFGATRLVIQVLAALFGTATIAALAWALRRGPGERMALAGAALAAFSFWIVMFSRVPVAENLVLLLLVLAAGFALGRTSRDWVLAGLFVGVAAFFGKIHALAIVPALALFLYFGRPRAALRFAALGFAAGGALWIALILIPQREAIFDQVFRAKELYGSSPLTKSPLETLLAPLRALRNSWFFLRFPFIPLVGGWFAISTLARRDAFSARTATGESLFASWVAGAWLLLSFLAYQAPRYFLIVAIPLAACAVFQIEAWRKGTASRMRDLGGRLGNTLLFAWLVLVSFAVVDGSTHWSGFIPERLYTISPDTAVRILVGTGEWTRLVQPFNGNAVAAIVLGALAFTIVKLRARGRRPKAGPRPGMALAAIVAMVGFDLIQYVDWMPRRSHALEEAKASFDAIVGPDAVVAGSFSPALVLGTRRVALPMYGTPRAGVFETYGVTHIVLGEPGSTREIEAASPGILDRLDPVRTWPIRTRHLRNLALYRIRDAEPIVAGRYQPTAFERAVDRILEKDYEGAILLLQEFLASRSDSIPDAVVLDAECRLALGREDEARALLEEAVRLRPQSPLELYNLGVLLERAGEKDRALELWKRGFAADPVNTDLAQALRETLK